MHKKEQKKKNKVEWPLSSSRFQQRKTCIYGVYSINRILLFFTYYRSLNFVKNCVCMHMCMEWEDKARRNWLWVAVAKKKNSFKAFKWILTQSFVFHVWKEDFYSHSKVQTKNLYYTHGIHYKYFCLKIKKKRVNCTLALWRRL